MIGDTPGNFDIVIVNDNLDHAYGQLEHFVATKVLNKSNTK